MREKANKMAQRFYRFRVSITVPDHCVYAHLDWSDLHRLYDNNLEKISGHFQNEIDALFQ